MKVFPKQPGRYELALGNGPVSLLSSHSSCVVGGNRVGTEKVQRWPTKYTDESIGKGNI